MVKSSEDVTDIVAAIKTVRVVPAEENVGPESHSLSVSWLMIFMIVSVMYPP